MTQNTESGDATERERSEESDRPPRGGRVRSTVANGARSGTAAAALGSLMLAGAARTVTRSRRRAGALAAGGAALFGVAVRQHRSGDDAAAASGERSAADDGSKVSAEAYAHRMAASTLNPADTSPRGVDGEPDVETKTDPGEGRIRFSTDADGDTAQKPHVDEIDPKDPRYPDLGEPGSEDPVDVSLSKTKMTDELGKVAGPDDDQAYPSREGTDPEPMSDRAPPRYGEGAVANPDSNEATQADEAESDAEAGDTEDEE
jgi:hypothetical protein